MRQPGKKRILHIVSSMDRGGAETLIMNVYRNVDRSQIQFDFIVHGSEKGDYEDEILEMGGKIYRILSLGQLGPIRYLKELVRVMHFYPYQAVHSHTDFQSGFPTMAAKLVGIKQRICHSHSTNWQKGERLKERVILRVFKTIIKISATSYCSCSEEAAIFLFGKHVLKKGKVKVLKNGIDVKKFANVDRTFRKILLEELQLPEEVITIGHVGTFSESKNQLFILKVLKSLLEKDSRFVMLLVGDGPLKQQIEDESKRLGIIDNIRFLGVRSDIPNLMNAFDLFLFPSKFEGFGIVALEAQSSGTPCVLSDAIPNRVDMGLGLVSFINLDQSIEVWCEAINKGLLIKRPDNKMIINKVVSKGYNIQNNIQDWLNIYEMNAVEMVRD
ncbi:glycosyl transferase family 1 [Bacillus sp. AFS073361]|uniref:glycosyltransferase family 1 protein n=1 Tax=Bacillus sp. AFS073361 TaxID=2033511 RepID=UPI000BF2FC99|nr:glycosyltransferase family 1 protein [Bacillus sp. AFS073361]PFP29493.1 glycosyl transferase family 1 [Bacillus sp. AFS073361]